MWQYKSKHEGDLVAKCYFAKRKLVWEVLEGELKSKMEIQWSDIMSLKANCPDTGPSSLTVAVIFILIPLYIATLSVLLQYNDTKCLAECSVSFSLNYWFRLCVAARKTTSFLQGD